MTNTWFPWALTALLGSAAVTLLVVLLLRLRSWRRRLRTAHTDHEQRLATQATSHAEETERIRSAHAQRLDAAQEQTQAAQVLTERLRGFCAQAINWELASRNLVASACADLSLHGALATNVMFVPVDAAPQSPFVAQIDHVLLTDRFALLIENKNWRGMVFDDVLPSSVLPSFGLLVEESALEPPFAIQLKRAEENGSSSQVAVMTRTGRQAPTTQVRIQARRFAEWVRTQEGVAPWFNTSVLYSHQDAAVFTPRSLPRRSMVRTDVMAGPSALRTVLARLHRENSQHAEASPVEVVGPLLSQHGADIFGFGNYSDRWTSALDLQHPAEATA